VAEGAVLWERRGNVIRYRAPERRGALPGSDVAIVAGCCTERVAVAYVAGNARRGRWGHVQSRQGKPRRAVIERRRGPTRCCMARAAIRNRKGRCSRGMRGIRGLLPGCQMAP
jgi:hypothetical protein